MINIKKFIIEEDGAETLEWAAVIVATAIIIFAVSSIVKAVRSKTQGLASHI